MKARPDVFALANTCLDVFLRAEIGAELNGSPLTMLSALARAGFDPWAEAGRWARLPQAAAIERVAGVIAQMPLCPESLQDAHCTATRLVSRLPGAPQTPRATKTKLPISDIAIIAGICLMVAVALLAGSPGTQADPPDARASQTHT